MAVQLDRISGEAIRPWKRQVADLRIRVFREWPYLYDGDMGYEESYLDTYVQSPRSVLVLALDQCSSAGPIQLRNEDSEDRHQSRS